MKRSITIFALGALVGSATAVAAPYIHKHYLHSQEVEQLINYTRSGYIDIGPYKSYNMEPKLMELCVRDRAACERETYSFLTDKHYLVCEYEDYHHRCEEHTKRAEIAKKIRQRFGFM